jgi:uncharacterized protein YjlB
MRDICYRTLHECPEADRRIEAVPDAKTDPVYGSEGLLIELWLGGNRRR